MKIKTILLTVICFLVFPSLNVFGQKVKPITKVEYDELDEFYKQTYKISRIVTNIRRQYDNKRLVKTTKLVQEYESEKRNRWTFHETKDEITKKTLEIIYFDGQEFRREHGKEWKEIERTRVGVKVVPGSARELSKLEQYALGETILEGKSVKLYSLYRVYNLNNFLIFLDGLTWVSDDGRILSHKEVRSNIFPNNIVEVSETKYKYNPKNLKIKIPKIPKVKK